MENKMEFEQWVKNHGYSVFERGIEDSYKEYLDNDII